MSATGQGAGQQPTEEELRAAYEAEIKKIRVEQVLLEHVVTLVNLGMRRTGIAPGTESERDPSQVRVAIEAIRALVPLVEQVASAQAAPIRDALSQLQLAYVKIGGRAPDEGATGPSTSGASGGSGTTPPAGGGAGAPGTGSGAQGGPQPPGEPPAPKPGEPGPAQRSGRLWVPGQ
jgi:hypothetical protein